MFAAFNNNNNNTALTQREKRRESAALKSQLKRGHQNEREGGAFTICFELLCPSSSSLIFFFFNYNALCEKENIYGNLNKTPCVPPVPCENYVLSVTAHLPFEFNQTKPNITYSLPPPFAKSKFHYK